ncbi:MAG: DUF4038 domain-containing protein, partial [Lentisphaeria bacterium]|nr:DUF4038 domain-containing protein [Lentisphaeria bacterium]
DRQRGRVEVRAPTEEEIRRNPNLRGHIEVSPDGRTFRYADGTPFFLLADTLWAGNTARCGLGEDRDGPFFRHLADRRAKGFTAILMQYFHGYGDYDDAPGHRNEGGRTFLGQPAARLNPAHFQALDRRLEALWGEGFVAAVPTTWWGKTRRCVCTVEDACRVSAYCAVRYGAFNGLWALSGEYQYAFPDCGWKAADFGALGATVQAHNPYRHPVSIHPSARLDWPAPHNVQSSRPFHGEAWLDHHWLQTGQSVDRLHNIPRRLAENRALTPARPVFCSEACYERVGDAESAYHTRWQVWTAFLCGAAGFGYGAHGVWQFYDPLDPEGETGKQTREVTEWRSAQQFPGASQVRHARDLLTGLAWWRLEPRREWLTVNGGPNPSPSARDLTPPHAASIPGEAVVIYVPRGNETRDLALTHLPGPSPRGRWFDPRTGVSAPCAGPGAGASTWALPRRPEPGDDDWVLVLESEGTRQDR